MKVMIASTADWDHPLQTNKQHVARALASAGAEVLYIESVALRTLSAHVEGDGKRVVRRLANVFRALRRPEPRLTVASPLVLPKWESRLARGVNRVALALQVSVWRGLWGRPDLLLTYSPVGEFFIYPLTLLAGRQKFRSVYHCVDDIAAQPGMPTTVIERFEASLVGQVDGVVTTSPGLTERMRRLGARNVLEQTNVVEFERFDAARRRGSHRRERKVVGFVGAISEYKLNLEWIAQAARARPRLDFQLFGPTNEAPMSAEAQRREYPPNVAFCGVVDQSEVPSVMVDFDVAVIPAPFNRYTHSMFPMKFFEYLAAGVPVVATRLSALAKFDDVAILVETFEEFLQGIDAAVAGDGPSLDKRLATAREYTYAARTDAMLAEIATW